MMPRLFNCLRPAAFSILRFYWRLTRPLTMGGRCIVLNDAGHVLLVRHTYLPGWYLPGGGVKKGETAKEAAIREVWEETGVRAQGDVRLHGLFANFREFKSDHVALYVVRSFSQEPSCSPEIADFGFFAPDALPEGTTASTRTRIEEVIGNRPASNHW